MKLNAKIIIPAFALLAGASLVGSISGTVAWYQYSTRANVSYIGSSAGVIGNLQVRINDGTDREWGPQVSTDDVLAYLGVQHVEPVTPGNLGMNDSLKEAKWNGSAAIASGDELPAGNEGDYYFKGGVLYLKGASEWADSGITVRDAAPADPHVGDKYFNSVDKKIYERVLAEKNFYVNPSFGVGPYNKWIRATAQNYVKIPLQLRFIGEDEQDLSAQNVYLSKLLIQKDTVRDANAANHGDISDAIRVHFSAYEEGDEENAVNRLVSKKGGTTLTHGKLNLGRGDDFDKAPIGDEWNFDGQGYDYVEYGEGSQKAYIASDEVPAGDHYYYEETETGWKQLKVALTGDVAPDAGDGADGDYYFDSAANKLYLKDSGAWGEVAAADYLSGDANPNLNTANPNTLDYFFNTANLKVFEREAPVQDNISPILVSEKSESPVILENTDGRSIGSTVATSNPQHYLNVDVTIWVEGWQKFERNGSLSAIWDENLRGAWFDVGMQFAVQDIR